MKDMTTESRPRHSSQGELKTVSLPPDAPARLVVSPTMNRWGEVGKPGHLVNMASSVQQALARDRMADDTWLVLNDASDRTNTSAVRSQGLEEIAKRSGSERARTFIVTPEHRRQIAALVTEETGIRERIVDALLTGTGYAEQRATLDVIAAGLVSQNGQFIDVLTLDDDTIIPERKKYATDLPEGLTRKNNSQVLFPNGHANIADDGLNSLKPFFAPLGSTIDELRVRHGEVRATRGLKDTMHGMLEKASRGEHAQFVVTHSDEDDMKGADKARIMAVAATKHGVPDYRTVKIAETYLKNEFPNEEVPVASYPSGDSKLFAFLEANTNVDSAALSRRMDTQTSVWPWWFISSLDVSLNNPLHTVTGHYRADNELLPVLMKVMLSKTGKATMYGAGIDTQVFHNRARSGYRPDMHDQSTASLVGNVAALEASRRLEFDPLTGEAKMYMVDIDYRAPEDHARRVFEEMRNLATICAAKVTELSSRTQSGGRGLDESGFAALNENIANYARVSTSIKGKLAGFNYDTFKMYLDAEVKSQLAFFSEVLNAMPVVTDQVRKLIKSGNYPILEFVK